MKIKYDKPRLVLNMNREADVVYEIPDAIAIEHIKEGIAKEVKEPKIEIDEEKKNKKTGGK